MPPRRDVPRTPVPQEVEQEAGVTGFIREVATAVRRMNRASAGEDGSSLLEKFLKLRPPVFRGKTDTLGPEAWIKKLTKIFEAMSAPDERRMTLIPFILEDEAEFWWDMIARTEDVEHMTWVAFKKLFLGKYFPQVERDARREEFEKLLQRGMTVAQYEAQFTELSRHAEYMVDTEEKKVSRFLRGLRPNIQSQLIMLMLTEYSDAVNQALLVERSLDERQKIFERSNGKRSGDGPPRGDETFMK